MKILTNSVGNYSPNLRVKTAPRQTKPAEPAAAETSTSPALLTGEEKKYFMGLYPQNSSEISNYHFYQKSGKMTGIQIGGNFDRRG